MLLVNEINSLRTELKRARDKITQYENALGFNQAAELRFRLQHAIEDRDEIEIQNDAIVDAKEALIQAQQEEIDSLATKVLKIQEFVHDSGRPDAVANVDHIKTVLSNQATA